MFAKLYSYIWGETDTEAISTQESLPEWKEGDMEQNAIENIENIPSPNLTDEGCQPDDGIMITESVSDVEDSEAENGWVHVKDYKVVALSDTESCISSALENERINEEIVQQIVKKDEDKARVMKARLPKRRRHSRKREHQLAQNNILLDVRPFEDANNQRAMVLEKMFQDRMMTRKAMRMSNTAALVDSSSNKPSKRRSFYTPNGFSGAVNNRKC